MKSEQKLKEDIEKLDEAIVRLKSKGNLNIEEQSLIAQMEVERAKCELDLSLYQPMGKPLTLQGPGGNRRDPGSTSAANSKSC